jgi:hypothetical protein
MICPPNLADHDLQDMIGGFSRGRIMITGILV